MHCLSQFSINIHICFATGNPIADFFLLLLLPESISYDSKKKKLIARLSALDLSSLSLILDALKINDGPYMLFFPMYKSMQEIMSQYLSG